MKEVYNFKDLVNGIELLPKELLNYNSILYRIHDCRLNKNYIGTAKYGIPNRLYDRHHGRVMLFRDNNTLKCRGMYHNMNLYLSEFQLIIEDEDRPENYERILIEETNFIKKFDSVLFGYNVSPDGKPGWKEGTVCVNDGVYDIYVYPEDVDRFLDNGFYIGSCKHDFLKGTIWINNGVSSKMILPKDLKEYETLGYTKGSLVSPNKGKIWVNNGKVSKLLDRNLLGTKEYSEFKFIGRIEGPRRKRGKYRAPKKVLVNNGTKEIRIPEKEKEKFLQNNPSYRLGRLKKNQ